VTGGGRSFTLARWEEFVARKIPIHVFVIAGATERTAESAIRRGCVKDLPDYTELRQVNREPPWAEELFRVVRGVQVATCPISPSRSAPGESWRM